MEKIINNYIENMISANENINKKNRNIFKHINFIVKNKFLNNLPKSEHIDDISKLFKQNNKVLECAKYSKINNFPLDKFIENTITNFINYLEDNKKNEPSKLECLFENLKTKDELEKTKDDLKIKIDELEKVKNELEKIKDELEKTKTEIEKFKKDESSPAKKPRFDETTNLQLENTPFLQTFYSDFKYTKNDLENTKNDLEKTKNVIKGIKDELYDIDSEIDSINRYNDRFTDRVVMLKNEFDSLKKYTIDNDTRTFDNDLKTTNEFNNIKDEIKNLKAESDSKYVELSVISEGYSLKNKDEINNFKAIFEKLEDDVKKIKEELDLNSTLKNFTEMIDNFSKKQDEKIKTFFEKKENEFNLINEKLKEHEQTLAGNQIFISSMIKKNNEANGFIDETSNKNNVILDELDSEAEEDDNDEEKNF